MTPTRRALVLLIVAVTGVLGFVMLVRHFGRFDFRREARRIHKITTPAGGEVADLSDPQREAFSIEVSWTVKTQLEWKDYTAFLKQEVPREYRVFSEDDRHIQFMRILGTDTLFLSVERLSDGPPLRARLNFSGHAS